ncbi:hypothetical protein KC726_00375 [Candidatus Woesebacteria bacterium]|nr:hypothetical protein [Candidatus Woesebacteria bacterium]
MNAIKKASIPDKQVILSGKVDDFRGKNDHDFSTSLTARHIRGKTTEADLLMHAILEGYLKQLLGIQQNNVVGTVASSFLQDSLNGAAQLDPKSCQLLVQQFPHYSCSISPDRDISIRLPYEDLINRMQPSSLEYYGDFFPFNFDFTIQLANDGKIRVSRIAIEDVVALEPRKRAVSDLSMFGPAFYLDRSNEDPTPHTLATFSWPIIHSLLPESLNGEFTDKKGLIEMLDFGLVGAYKRE